jgi:hypothetical protein
MADPLIPVAPLRLRHGQGESLSGQDFSDQAAQDDQLRWWHDRALHRAYGVAQGLEVDLASEPGTAVVSPGLAYDQQGRELILRTERRLAVPPGPGPYRLVIGYRAVGGPDGAVVLGWVAASRPVARAGVPLASSDGTTFTWPRARPIAAPRIGRGVVNAAITSVWDPWTETFADARHQIGIQRWIDTSAAGFTAIPCYFVQYTGPLWFTSPYIRSVLDLPIQPLHHVTDATKDGFLFRMLMPVAFITFNARRRRAAGIPAPAGPVQTADTFLIWTGIQMDSAQSAPPTRTGDPT